MKHRRTREIVIELTSLLDVVMILIFAVLLQNSQLIDKKNQEVAAAEQENAGLQEEIDGLQDIISGLNEKIESLAGDNEILKAELADAISTIEKGNIDDLADKLEKYENAQAVMQAIGDYVCVYCITETTINDGSGDLGYIRNDFTYGPLFGDEEKLSIEIPGKMEEENEQEEKQIDEQKSQEISNKAIVIKNAIYTYIKDNLSGELNCKNFYIVIFTDDEEAREVSENCINNIVNEFTGNDSVTKVLLYKKNIDKINQE